MSAREALLVERMTSPWWTADTSRTEAEETAARERREVADRGRIRGVS